MKETFSKIARYVTKASGSVWASVTAFLFIILWTIGGLMYFGFGSGYQMIVNTVTTVVTFLIVFLIQHVQNTETKAINIKLDELILSKRHADNRLIDIENLTEDQLDRIQQRYKKIAEKHRQAEVDAPDNSLP